MASVAMPPQRITLCVLSLAVEYDSPMHSQPLHSYACGTCSK